MKQINKSGRTRDFATVVYPESAPENWLDILKKECVPAFVSPLHDKDIQEGSAEPKKAHYHVMVMFTGVKSTDQWEQFKSLFGGVGTEYIQSRRGYARYLCHLDNPEKHQYCTDDVIEIAGADYNDTIKRDSDKYAIIRQMITYVRNNHVTSYCELMDYAMEFEPEWYRSLSDNSSFVINTYITDQRRDLLMRNHY